MSEKTLRKKENNSIEIIQFIEGLEKLQQNINILQRAIANPPAGSTNQDMILVKKRLQSALQSEKRAIICLRNAGINVSNKID